MRGGQPLWIMIGLLAAAALAWNGLRFAATTAKPRTKDIDFLPTPLVARALACGQETAIAKLRWIDSFAYFQLQLDRQDDRVAGNDARGGFERLYDTLIALDPHFLPFYEHAVLNTGGVLKHHGAALGFIMRGLLEQPYDTALWRLASAELAISFDWTKRDPALLDRWLNAWADAEQTQEGLQRVIDWRRGLAFASVDGLETLPYWIVQLKGTKPDTPLADFVEGTVRELLAEHGARELTRLVAPASPGRGFPERILGGPLLPDTRIDIPAAVLHARWPQGAPAYAPVHWNGRRWELRSDPFGWDWRREGARVVSPGREQRRFLVGCLNVRRGVEAQAQQHGRPPRDVDEAQAWGCALPQPPDGGRWSFAQMLPDVVWSDPPHEPWPLR